VRREGGATCTDAVDGFADLALRGRRGRRLTLRLGEQADPLDTRCGGPMLADVAGLCAPLDACGASGELALVPEARGGRALFLEPRGARVRVTYLSAAPVRTRCPGPLLGVALGQPAPASGTLPAGAFARARVTLRLTRGARLEDGPYAGISRSDLTVVLRRTALTTRVEG